MLALLGQLVGAWLRAFQFDSGAVLAVGVAMTVQAVVAHTLAHEVDDLVLGDRDQPAARRPAGRSRTPSLHMPTTSS